MSDNNQLYKADMLSIVESQQARVNESLSVVEHSTNKPLPVFVRSTYEFRKIRDRQTEPDIKATLSGMLLKICTLSGIKGQIDQLNGADISKAILHHFNDLTLEELWMAFKLERAHEYPEKTEHYNLFNLDYIGAVIKKYRAWKLQIKQANNITRSTAPQLPELSEGAKKDLMNQGIVRKFHEFRESGKIEEPFAYIFDDLYERDIIKRATAQTPKLAEYYQSKLQQAQAELKSEYENATSVHKNERLAIREELAKIESGNTDKAEVRAKRLVLQDFFTMVMGKELDINEILK